MRRTRTWVCLAGAGVLLMGAWPVVGYVDSARHSRLVASAKSALAWSSVGEARQILADVSARWPEDGEAWFLLGACDEKLGQPDSARTAYARVPADSPFASHAGMFLARLLLARDRFSDAEAPLLTALRGSGPHAREARLTLVNIFKIEGRFAEARALVVGASGEYPDPAGLVREAESLGSNNPIAIEEARAKLERVSNNAPDDDRIWLGWANLALRTGQFEEASRQLERCLKRRPDDPAVWRSKLDLGLGLESPEQVSEAARHLPEDRLGPADILWLQAWLAARMGDADAERRAHERMVALEPGSIASLGRLAELSADRGEEAEAARLRARRAELQRVKYDYQVLIDKVGPDNARDAARLAERLGRVVESASLWLLVIQSHPSDREAIEALARLRSRPSSTTSGPTLRDLLATIDLPKPGPSKERGQTRLSDRGIRFVDDAVAVGLAFTFDNGRSPARQMPETMSGGVAILDYDGDGWPDVYCVQAGPFPPDRDAPKSAGDRLFRNRGDGTFEDVTGLTGLAAFALGYGHGVAVGDFDNDGRPDLFVTRWRRYGLYRNRGDGTFEDATDSVGLSGDRDWPTSAAFADLDGDGDLDLYVCHYCVWDEAHPIPCKNGSEPAYCSPQYSKARPDHLFRNDGGHFVDVSDAAGITAADRDGRGLGVVAEDLDGDGKLDLFVANDQSANYLFRNLGGMRFEEVAAVSGVACGGDGTYQASMGVALGDFDGDGLPDLAKTNFYNEGSTLYRNLGRGAFADVSTAVGLAAPSRYLLGFGIAFLDADTDGWGDLATANGHVDDPGASVPYAMPAQLLLNDGRGRLVDASRLAGPPWQVARIARGLARGDLDNDGRVDLLVQSEGTPLAYFHNQTRGGHSLTIRLEGTASNRDAVGARVTVQAGGRSRVAWRSGGGSYQSASDPRLHFGLGSLTRVDNVEVAWPSGRFDRLGPLEADRGYLIREGDPAPAPLPGFAAQADLARP